MDKRVIVAELRDIFNLLNACFDVKAVVNLISRHKIWNKAIQQIASKAEIDLPTDFKPEGIVYNNLKSHKIGEDVKEYIVDWVFTYLFYPKALDKPNVTPVIDTFKNLMSKNPNREHNFAGFLADAIPNVIKMYFRENYGDREPIIKEKSDDDKSETPKLKSPAKVKELAINELKLKPETKTEDDEDGGDACSGRKDGKGRQRDPGLQPSGG